MVTGGWKRLKLVEIIYIQTFNDNNIKITFNDSYINTVENLIKAQTVRAGVSGF